jgi:hypothetical protein
LQSGEGRHAKIFLMLAIIPHHLPPRNEQVCFT